MARQATVWLSRHRLQKGLGCGTAMQLGRGNAPRAALPEAALLDAYHDRPYPSVDSALHEVIGGLT